MFKSLTEIKLKKQIFKYSKACFEHL